MDNPRWGNTGLLCEDCPYTDEDGGLDDGPMAKLCNTQYCAKDMTTYAEACALAEAAEKEGR